MKYKYIPNNFKRKDILEKFSSEDEFIKCQAKYKLEFEKLLVKQFDIEPIVDYVDSQKNYVPKMSDVDYNFYHKFSGLGSDYIYIRNNYHVERLDRGEIKTLLKEESPSVSFFNNNWYKVLFDGVGKSVYGIPLAETILNSQTVIFEFAYDQKKCKDLVQLNQIDNLIDSVKTQLKQRFDKANIATSYLTYDGITDLFFEPYDTTSNKLER